jgi:hypothetical protein
MSRRLNFAYAVFTAYVSLAAPPADASSIDVWSTRRKVTSAEANSAEYPAPANGDVHEFFVTTDADILAFHTISITGDARSALYQNPLTIPPLNALLPVDWFERLLERVPSVGVDSFVDTPGTTSRLGADLPGDGLTLFGDLDNNGPQTAYRFARLTLPAGVSGVFNVTASILSTTQVGTPYAQTFSLPLVPIPEPTAGALALAAAAGFVARRRRW